MLRRLVTALFEISLRIFFRRVEVAGADHVGDDKPVLYVVNHPNGLIDSALLLCRSPRRVSFLAKSTLFRVPVIGWMIRALDSLPVYRRQDAGSNMKGNAATFGAARSLLKRGIAIAIFPEGVSHSDPQMRPLKTGAARIALGAQLEGLEIVPAGLYFLNKTSFRSAALVCFGAPIPVTRVDLIDGDPPREAVDALTDQIRVALERVILSAEQREAIALCERAERIVRAADQEDTGADDQLAERLTLRQRLVEGYHALRVQHPVALERVVAQVDSYYAELERLRLTPEHLAPHEFSTRTTARYALTNGLALVALLGPALVGMVTHYPAYRLLGPLATRIAVKDKEGGEDLIATVKLFGGMLLFPVSWLVVAIVVGLTLGWVAAGVSLVVVPVCGYLALRFQERLEKVAGAARGLAAFLTPKGTLARLDAERARIRDEIVALDALVPQPGHPSSSGTPAS